MHSSLDLFDQANRLLYACIEGKLNFSKSFVPLKCLISLLYEPR
jgi:hypothetical protein